MGVKTNGKEVFANMNKAYDDGYAAFSEGRLITNNPYIKDALYKRNWESGWKNAQIDKAENTAAQAGEA